MLRVRLRTPPPHKRTHTLHYGQVVEEWAAYRDVESGQVYYARTDIPKGQPPISTWQDPRPPSVTQALSWIRWPFTQGSYSVVNQSLALKLLLSAAIPVAIIAFFVGMRFICQCFTSPRKRTASRERPKNRWKRPKNKARGRFNQPGARKN